MCTGGELALLAAAGASTAVAYDNAQDARKDASAARESAAADRRKAEVDAVNRAQAKTQMQKKALRDNSLFTGAGESGRTSLGV